MTNNEVNKPFHIDMIRLSLCLLLMVLSCNGKQIKADQDSLAREGDSLLLEEQLGNRFFSPVYVPFGYPGNNNKDVPEYFPKGFDCSRYLLPQYRPSIDMDWEEKTTVPGGDSSGRYYHSLPHLRP